MILSNRLTHTQYDVALVQIINAMYRDGTCTSSVAADGTTVRDPCPDAYGKVLGTFFSRF
jgi:hypothetical protein